MVFSELVRSGFAGDSKLRSERTLEPRDSEDAGGRRWTDQDHQGLECSALVLLLVLVGMLRVK